MADENKRIDLVQRYAEKLRQDGRGAGAAPPFNESQAARKTLVERAMESASAPPPSEPAAIEATTQASAPPPPLMGGGAAMPPHLARGYADLDLAALRRAGYVTPGSQSTRLAEEYRVIKRPLLVKAFGKQGEAVPNGQIIMITSARPGEGKTFTALNLALSMASERNISVVLVDCDATRPDLTTRLGIKPQAGLF
ncbi:MAG: hypothetical protein K2Q10_08725, partial [Rhodospirillales bacterium]|nr:hypothetical protein [Rhodospirillales bacterium]